MSSSTGQRRGVAVRAGPGAEPAEGRRARPGSEGKPRGPDLEASRPGPSGSAPEATGTHRDSPRAACFIFGPLACASPSSARGVTHRRTDPSPRAAPVWQRRARPWPGLGGPRGGASRPPGAEAARVLCLREASRLFPREPPGLGALTAKPLTTPANAVASTECGQTLPLEDQQLATSTSLRPWTVTSLTRLMSHKRYRSQSGDAAHTA